jgi:hypothetical protein
MHPNQQGAYAVRYDKLFVQCLRDPAVVTRVIALLSIFCLLVFSLARNLCRLRANVHQVGKTSHKHDS